MGQNKIAKKANKNKTKTTKKAVKGRIRLQVRNRIDDQPQWE